MLDLAAFARTPLCHQPCDFLVVPQFVRPEALADLNRDFPAIERPGNFPPEDLVCGPTFAALLTELHSDAVRNAFAAKFGIDLTPYPLQITVRRFSEAGDGNVHNDSKMKIVTTLIYFNSSWSEPGGQLRLMRSPRDLQRYAVEVPPVDGNLLTFRRSQHSYHGFLPYVGERRSLQMYWVKPKRSVSAEGVEKQMSLKKRIKRYFKERRR
jgi:hypothetical protein